MIRIREATMLALTKLRTRKVRLVVTVVISGLLFTALAAASMVARGTFASIKSFGEEGLSERYIAQASPSSMTNLILMTNPEVIDRATAINKEIVARKKAEAKRLGIEYSAENENQPVETYPGPNASEYKNLNPTHPAAIQAAQEFLAKQSQAAVTIDTLKTQAAPYDPRAFYESRTVPYDLGGGQLKVMKDGRESFETKENNASMGGQNGTDSFGTSWTLMSKELLKPFILQGQSLDRGSDGSMPIIIPVTAAEQLAGIKKLPASATAAERLERTKELRKAAAAIRFGVCYRNAASLDLIQKAISAQQEIDRNKGKKDYRKPDLQYGLPDAACGPVPVIRDVRTKDQKQQDTKQAEFDRIFGATDQAASLMQFRVVGLVPDADYSMSMSAAQIIKSLVASSLGSGWYAPMESMAGDPVADSIFFSPSSPFAMTYPAYYAEFSAAGNARSFIDKEHCEPDYSRFNPQSSAVDPAQKCADAGKPFALGPYGSNSLGLEGAQRGFAKVFSIAGLVITVIASLIMMGTVGKMVSDSRRETAVFRAIGAKKIDIAQIYLLYTLFLSALVAAFAIAVGLILAFAANAYWSSDITPEALIVYNAQDLGREFRLYGFYLPDMLYVVAATILAGLLSSVIPLFRSLRRNPIRDMRDDT